MPSLKDLAKECGVSVATVSKALNDQPDISPATRERVRAAAHRMGYMPNAAARSLKTNRTYNLGVLFVDERQSGLTHEYFSAVLDSFKVEAEKHGYDITFINHNISGKSMSYLEHCRYRNVDGVVIACVNFYEPQVVELVNSEVPVVTIDHVFNNRMAILSDNVSGLKALVRQAWACGHRRIAFIHGEKTAVTENRVAGFYQACEELGLKIPEAYVREGIYHDADRCAAETKALLELPQPPTCIIFPDDFSALGGYNVFNPDIRYVDGYPGESCYNCLMPGITMMIAKGYIDEKGIGAQGHSWGGYQVAYLATRTNLFSAIESGAPVVNMFSAYGGIRWGSGMARSFQYEHTQSRLGATPWSSPLRYLENSPLFTMDKVQTPILIMHNDADGHVPWYQGIEYFVAMKRLGKPCWLLNYTGEPHWPMHMANRIDFQRRMFQFFNHYLKNDKMPKWMSEGVPAVEQPFELGY